jgi:phage/plasmid-associated DNA primase
MLDIINNWTIDLENLPSYADFKKPFTVPFDKKLSQLLISGTNPKVTDLMISNFKNNIYGRIGNDNAIEVRHNNRHGVGRFYSDSDTSPCCHTKFIKHTVFKYQDWLDIDMVKGHPSILLSLLERNGKSCSTFYELVNDFGTKWKEIAAYYKDKCDVDLDEDNVKYFFNMVIYGGGYTTWIKKLADEKDALKFGYPVKIIPPETPMHPFMIKFHFRCKEISDLVYQNNPELVARVSDPSKSEYQNKNTTMSYFCGIIENHIVDFTYKFLVKKGAIVPHQCLLEMDGLCLPRLKDVDYDPIIKQLNDCLMHVGVKFKIKPYTDKFVLHDMIDKRREMMPPETTTDSADDITVEAIYAKETRQQAADVIGITGDDKDAAEALLQLYPHWVCCHNELFVYDDSTGLWNSDMNSQIKIMGRFVEELRVWKKDKKGVDKPTRLSYGSNTSLQKQIIPQIKALCIDNDWVRRTELSSLGKILFLNGYYDFRAGQFYDTFDPDIVFVCRIDQTFEAMDSADVVYMNDIKRRMFLDPLGHDVGDYFTLNIARGLAGDMMKRLFFGLGGTDCGKTTITQACKFSLGEYFGSFNGENLAFSRSTADEGAQMRWVMLLKNKRIIFSNEMKSTVELNGNMIKKISSGGDSIIARVHGGLETEFVPQFLAVCMANDINKITPYDKATANRVRVIPYDRQFVDNPANEFQLKKDYNLDAEMKTERFQKAFVRLLIVRYSEFQMGGRKEVEPPGVVSAKNDWIGDEKETDIVNKFLGEFEITGNIVDHYARSSDIEYWLKGSNLGVSMKCFCKDLKKYCGSHGFHEVASKDKKLNGKTVKVWRGIKQIVEEEEEEELIN